jgi:hypothetical protein
MTTTDNFYADLPILEQFAQVADTSSYQRLPDDWHIVVTDVRGSTRAIDQGRYKEVNTLGVAVITSILNIAKPLNVPFVFGGDGATLCIPSSLVAQVPGALVATKQMAQDEYGLEFRIGIIPVADIHQKNVEVLVSRFRVSNQYVQAVFSGGGLQLAENLLKDPTLGARYQLNFGDAPANADYSGLECRWQSIPSPYGETIALMVTAMGDESDTKSSIYQTVINKIGEIFGDIEHSRPITMETLQPVLDPAQLTPEATIRTYRRTWWQRLLYWLEANLRLRGIGYLLKKNVEAVVNPFNSYKEQLIQNTDTRKFDDMLRLVISGTSEQRSELETYLEQEYQRGNLVYGLHISPAAVMTCMVMDVRGEHYHFIDGSNGGYALAAREMKARMKKP